MTRIWLFGEAEWETNEDFEKNSKRLFDVSENCGYMIQQGKTKLILEGTDLDVIKAELHTGSKCNMLIIQINQTTQDGSKLAKKWEQHYAAFTDSEGKVIKEIEAQ